MTQLDVEGCFTLPGAEIGTDAAEAQAVAVADPSPEVGSEKVAGQVDQPAEQAPAH